jgi:hypothetical protein
MGFRHAQVLSILEICQSDKLSLELQGWYLETLIRLIVLKMTLKTEECLANAINEWFRKNEIHVGMEVIEREIIGREGFK